MKNNYLFILFIFILSFIGMFSCSYNKYPDKEIVELNYYTISSFVPNKNEITIDLEKNQVLKRSYIDGEEPIEFTVTSVFDENSKKTFHKQIIKYGIYNINEEYYQEGIDGSNWFFTLTFSDGSKLNSKGYIKIPSQAKKIDLACYELFGDDFFGTLPTDYKIPELFNISINYEKGNTFFSDHCDHFITNYSWRKARFTEVDNIFEYALENSISLSTIFDYRYSIWTYNMDHRFSNLTIKSYDLNGNDEKIVGSYKWFKKKEWNLELNRIYVFEATYSLGSVQSVFCVLSED